MITTMVWVIIVIRILVLLMILVLKMTKKYHITWYWCQNIRDNMVEKQGQKIWAGVSPLPPLFGQCPKENIFFFREGFPKLPKQCTMYNELTSPTRKSTARGTGYCDHGLWLLSVMTQCKNECRILSHGVSKILRACRNFGKVNG